MQFNTLAFDVCLVIRKLVEFEMVCPAEISLMKSRGKEIEERRERVERAEGEREEGKGDEKKQKKKEKKKGKWEEKR